MKIFLKISALVFVILVSMAAFSLFIFHSVQKTKNLPQITSKIENLSDSNRYFIAEMRKRKYEGGEIKIEKNLGNSGKFTSYIVSYSSDGLKIFGLLAIPTTKKPASGFPVIIINHGYVNPESYSTVNSYRKIADYFASQGFLVLKPDFRGHGDSDGVGGTVLARLEYATDVLNLIASLPTLPYVDSEKIFIYGHSMGGDVTLRVLEITNKVKASTLWAPATTEFPESLLYFVRRHRPEMLPEIEAGIKATFSSEDFTKLSPVDNTNFAKAHVNIHHGTKDTSVPFEWSQNLAKKLADSGVSYNFYQYSAEDHNFTRGSWGQAAARDLELFKKFL